MGMPLMRVHRTGQRREGCEPQLAFLRADDALPRSRNPGSQAIDQLPAKPALKREQDENDRCGKKIGPTNLPSTTTAPPFKAAPNAETDKRRQQDQANVPMQVNESVGRHRQISTEHIDTTGHHRASRTDHRQQ